ncbi:MAG TPA: MotA/TolQ/ExbB proton channel family protein [Bacteroidota bacterium]|nr:MotA/TolQ/ExbB proton channel family protein [Bacteroidota bacterium]
MKRSFDIATAGGLSLGVIAIFGSFMLEGGSMGALILLPAMTIVFLGTFAAAIIGTSLKNFLQVPPLIRLALFPPSYEVKETIDSIVRYSTVARKEGLLALEKELGKVTNAFMKKILRFAIDGTEPEVLRALAETEVNYVGERHSRSAAIFQKMGGYSPTMGIIGTVMGLIATLASAGEDANILIRHIASAFIATLWGVFMANIVWLPIADKLKHIHEQEYLFMDMIVEGVLSIQAGEVPSVIKAKLNSMLPAAEQEVDA